MNSTTITLASIAFALSISGCAADSADDESVGASEDGVHTGEIGQIAAIRATTQTSRTVTIGAPAKVEKLKISLGLSGDQPLREGQPRCYSPSPSHTFDLLDPKGATLGTIKLSCLDQTRGAGTLTLRGKSFVIDAAMDDIAPVLESKPIVGDVLWGITSVREESPDRNVTVKLPARVKSLLDAVGLEQEARANAMLPQCVPNEKIVFLRGTEEVAKLGVFCSLQSGTNVMGKLEANGASFGLISVNAQKMNWLFAQEPPLAQPNQ